MNRWKEIISEEVISPAPSFSRIQGSAAGAGTTQPQPPPPTSRRLKLRPLPILLLLLLLLHLLYPLLLLVLLPLLLLLLPFLGLIVWFKFRFTPEDPTCKIELPFNHMRREAKAFFSLRRCHYPSALAAANASRICSCTCPDVLAAMPRPKPCLSYIGGRSGSGCPEPFSKSVTRNTTHWNVAGWGLGSGSGRWLLQATGMLGGGMC